MLRNRILPTRIPPLFGAGCRQPEVAGAGAEEVRAELVEPAAHSVHLRAELAHGLAVGGHLPLEPGHLVERSDGRAEVSGREYETVLMRKARSCGAKPRCGEICS